jgi:hypothetical protein
MLPLSDLSNAYHFLAMPFDTCGYCAGRAGHRTVLAGKGREWGKFKSP